MTLAIPFLASVLSCLSPCVLPVIPVFLAQVRAPIAALPGTTAVAAMQVSRAISWRR